jgi:hypothetical protein
MIPLFRSWFAFALLALASCAPAAPPATTTADIGEVPAGGAPPATGEPSARASAEPAKPPPASDAKVRTLFVKEELVDCEGEGPMKCMLVREDGSDEYTLMYDPIEGFAHEAGYRYELEVETSGVANPPADGSSLRTRLTEVVSKEKVQ